MRRLLDALASLRFTLFLLVALGALFLAGLAIPQKAVLQRALYEQWRAGSPTAVALLEAIGLTDVYRSPIACALWGAFFLNLGVVTVRRIPGTVRRVRIDGAVPAPAECGAAVTRDLPCSRDGLERARAFFERKRFAVHADGGRFRAVRNRHAPLATLAFHLSFFVIAAGAAASVATRFEGEVDLGEGEQFTGALEQYAKRPKLPPVGGVPETQFLLESIRPEASGETATAVRMTVLDRRGFRREFEINRPLRTDGISFVFRNVGVAPLLVLTDAAGAERFSGFMRLDLLQGREDAFSLLGLRFRVALFPDYVRDAEGERSRSQEMKDPVFRLSAEAPSGRSISRALRPGDSMEIGPYRLTVVDWRYWVRLYVRAERGLGVLWFGLALGSAGVAWRLFRYRREYVAEWVATPGGGRLVVAARAEYYRALFEEEATRLLGELEVALAPAVTADASGR